MANMTPNFIKVDIMRLNPRKKKSIFNIWFTKILSEIENKDIMIIDKLIWYLICLSAFSGNLLLNHYIIIRFIFFLM
jgi:hypothetical protein